VAKRAGHLCVGAPVFVSGQLSGGGGVLARLLRSSAAQPGPGATPPSSGDRPPS
jgi:hypothetical protein